MQVIKNTIGRMEDAGGSDPQTAVAATAKVTVDGKALNAASYTIQGRTYFKLRDILRAFDVGVTWGGSSRTIKIDTAAGYALEQKTDEIQWLPSGYVLVDQAGQKTQPWGRDSITDILFFAQGTHLQYRNTTKNSIGFIDTTTGKITFEITGASDAFLCSDGMIAVRQDSPSGDPLWGYYSLATGTQVIPYQYPEAQDFVDGFANVSTRDGDALLRGVIDQTGQVVLPFQYTYLRSPLNHGFAPASTSPQGELWGCVNASGEWVIPMQYADILYKNAGQPTFIFRDNGRYGFVLLSQLAE